MDKYKIKFIFNEDKDINDLKRFIDTVVYFILYNLNVDEADEIVNSQ